MITNNVTRMLISKKIGFKVFELPKEKLGALESARLMGVPGGQVLKTIVVEREKPGKGILAVIPGDREVDLKALAAAVGEKKMHLPTEREAERLTGLQAGGISPLALMNKGFEVWIDRAAQEFNEIHISGGQRGLNIRLGLTDLVKLTNARFAEISTIRVKSE
ncbi:MAG: aminoacyl-tRNA deacylase [Anaerolineaceae bacterium]|nr:aminoacyl-tRNA deacylase [Anaerolineaceae bacterium]